MAPRVVTRTALLVSVLVLTGACGGESRGELAPVGAGALPVQVITVEPAPLPRVLPAVGTFASPEATMVAAEIPGTVVDFAIPEGQHVDAGHLLARLDDAEARAALSVARARFQSAQNRYNRVSSLARASVASQQAQDDATAELNAARGQLEEARTRLEKSSIRAPFRGVLGLRKINRGQYLQRGDPIVEITRIDTLEVEISVPQEYAPEVRVGQPVKGNVGLCGQRFEGSVGAIDPQVNRTTRMLPIKAVVPNPDGALFPGMSARLRLVIGTLDDAIVVPQEAIVRLGTKHLVFVIDANGAAEQREVQLGEFFVDGVHVVQGLAAGERVVAAGHQKLRTGVPTVATSYEPTRNTILELGWYGPVADCVG